jgi:hypothetical protein
MCSAPTCHMTKVRPSINSPHQGLVSRLTPEYQCPWFKFYRASNFYCVMIAAEPLLPSGPPLETRVTATAAVASTAIAVANDNDHPCNGHDVDDYTRHAPSNAVAASAITTADAAAAAAVNNEDDDNDNVQIHPTPQPTAAVGGNTVEAAGTTSKQVAMLSVISSAAKISLRAYFEGANWLLNKALPRGAEFLCGPLGDIVRQYCLKKMQVARQLQNYKKGKFMNTQVSILLNQSDLDERIREGIAMSTPKFVSSTLLRICDPDPSSHGSDFSNLCVVMNSLPSMARTFVLLLAAAGVPNAQLDFKRAKELKMRAFIADFMKEYDSTGLPPADVSSITFGRLGAFLHLALFQAWSDAICDNEKQPIEFPVDCLIGRYALPVVYYVAGWTLYIELTCVALGTYYTKFRPRTLKGGKAKERPSCPWFFMPRLQRYDRRY